MLIGTIRTTETRDFELEGNSLDDLYRGTAQRLPENFEVAAVTPKMAKGQIGLTGTAVIRRREIAEIEGTSIDDLRAKVPEGWMLVSVRQEP